MRMLFLSTYTLKKLFQVAVLFLKGLKERHRVPMQYENLLYIGPYGTRCCVDHHSCMLSPPLAKTSSPQSQVGNPKVSRLASLGLSRSSTNRFAYNILSSFLCDSSNEFYCLCLHCMMFYTFQLWDENSIFLALGFLFNSPSPCFILAQPLTSYISETTWSATFPTPQ